MTENTANKAPQQGRAVSGAMQVRESAPENAPLKDALGQEPQRVDPFLADKTVVKEFGKNEKTGEPITAAATPVGETGAYGMALPTAGEVAGGNLKAVLEPPPTTDLVNRPLTKEQAAMQTKVYQRIAGLVARPPSEWGLIGPGDTIRGHMLLLDLNTGEKVRGMDGHRVAEGGLYANLRNLPEALSTGDIIERILA